MIFALSNVGPREREAVARIYGVWSALRHQVAEPRRWTGSLRRQVFAQAVQGSNSIEGYHATLDDVLDAVEGEAPLDAADETVLALQGYRDAMTYVLGLAEEDDLAIDTTLIRSLHYMMIKHDLKRRPGRWRAGAIFVRRDPDGVVVYEGPDRELVPGLMEELAAAIAADDGPMLVRAAMAHLNLVLIHPFADGNGRMARCLQTLVLARNRVLSPVFSSIEEYLGANTQAYYDMLAQVGRGGWHPDRDPTPWVRFCLNAHYNQALLLLWRIDATERLWEQCEELAGARGVPSRAVGPLCDAAQGLRLRNASYRHSVKGSEGDDISEQTASLDLRKLVAAGLLDARGETRGRYYVGTELLRSRWSGIAPLGRSDLFAETPDQTVA